MERGKPGMGNSCQNSHFISWYAFPRKILLCFRTTLALYFTFFTHQGPLYPLPLPISYELVGGQGFGAPAARVSFSITSSGSLNLGQFSCL